MAKPYAILPCNGLDKCAGSMTKEISLKLAEDTGSEIICPVFYRVADARYNKLVAENPLLVLDGCATRCASKLAAEKNLKIAEKLNISEEAKKAGVELGSDLRLSPKQTEFAHKIAAAYSADKNEDAENSGAGSEIMPLELHYQVYQKDKFVFRVPEDAGFYFNENDVWAYVKDGKARIGVTDYVQKSLSDIMFFTPPAVGAEISQFEEAGSIESGKAVFEIVSPVSGTITAVNEKLLEAPELINQNPYEQGWIAELELADFDDDKDLLHEFAGYFPVLKRKVDEFHV